MISRVPPTSAILLAYITLVNSPPWTSPTWFWKITKFSMDQKCYIFLRNTKITTINKYSSMNCLHMIYRVPLTSALLPAYITLSNSSLWTSPTWTLRSCLFVHSFLHTSQWRIFLHAQSSHGLQGANYFCSPSCIHHIGNSPHEHLPHLIQTSPDEDYK